MFSFQAICVSMQLLFTQLFTEFVKKFQPGRVRHFASMGNTKPDTGFTTRPFKGFARTLLPVDREQPCAAV